MNFRFTPFFLLCFLFACTGSTADTFTIEGQTHPVTAVCYGADVTFLAGGGTFRSVAELHFMGEDGELFTVDLSEFHGAATAWTDGEQPLMAGTASARMYGGEAEDSWRHQGELTLDSADVSVPSVLVLMRPPYDATGTIRGYFLSEGTTTTGVSVSADVVFLAEHCGEFDSGSIE